MLHGVCCPLNAVGCMLHVACCAQPGLRHQHVPLDLKVRDAFGRRQRALLRLLRTRTAACAMQHASLCLRRLRTQSTRPRQAYAHERLQRAAQLRDLLFEVGRQADQLLAAHTGRALQASHSNAARAHRPQILCCGAVGPTRQLVPHTPAQGRREETTCSVQPTLVLHAQAWHGLF